MSTLRELASLVNGEVVGDPDVEITGVAEIQAAKQGSITFLLHKKYHSYLESTDASAVVVDQEETMGNTNLLRVDNPHLAFVKLLAHFAPPVPYEGGVHPTAVIDPSAKIGDSVSIGPFSVISPDSVIGSNVILGAHVVVEEKAVIGAGSQIDNGVIVGRECQLGCKVIVQSGSVIGSYGFGYVTEKDVHLRVPQLGRVLIGDEVEIGANCTIDRGTISDTVIGKGTKLDNLVHIAHNVRIGKGCLITAHVAIAGSTVIGDYVAFGGQSGAVDHVVIGDRAQIASRGGITKSVPGGKIYSGMPAREAREQNKIDAYLHRLPELMKRIRELEREVEKAKRKE
ncbi:MAG: UDP-3-O-(3-hydroxymyristoyl)glucosamine N-acyltransferase [Fidelibacterota bacterium]